MLAYGISDVAIAEEPVIFADANFKAVVEEALGISDPTPEDMLGLTSLYAYGNQISDITGIGYAINLVELDLVGNQITSLPPEVGSLVHLSYLDLTDNQLTFLPPEIGKLVNLSWLLLWGNQLTSLPSEIGNLTDLSGLDLRGNHLTSLPYEIGNWIQLSYLDLTANQLTSLPSEIGNLTELTELYLSDNQLSSLPSEIGNLVYLSRLYADGNKLVSLPPEIGNLENLNLLYLSDNHITSLPPEIGNLFYMFQLDLGGNQLTSLPSEIGSLIHLSELILSYNQLSSIPLEMGYLTNLLWLSLEGNPLNTVSHCSVIPVIQNNCPSITFTYDPNPNPLTNDCSTSMDDLMVLASLWLSTPCNADNNWCEGADLTGDTRVDMVDFAVVEEQWLMGNRLPEDMVIIPAGTFEMGNSTNPDDGTSEEMPVHTVTLDSFAMGKYEITNGQYCAFLKSMYPSHLRVVNGIVYASNDPGNNYPYCTTSSAPRGYPNYGESSQIDFLNNTFSVRIKGGQDMTNYPMVMVTWYGAAAYCNWRSIQEHRQTCYYSRWQFDPSKNGYRLPTEAEWEYAARGGLSGKRFPFGDTITHSQVNYNSRTDELYDISPTRGYHPTWNDGIMPYTSPVGSFPSNGYDLYDMVGNVKEWCYDLYGYYDSIPLINPTGPVTGRFRVLRGGCWNDVAFSCRVSYRSMSDQYNSSSGFGFRVVLNLD